MTIQTDQATVDRWLADGRWVQFAPGEVMVRTDRVIPGTSLPDTYAAPPADWTEAPPCETCGGEGSQPVPFEMPCPDCGGSGKQRLAVQVPCACWTGDGSHRFTDCHICWNTGLVTVAWATVEWGPLPVDTKDRPHGPKPAHLCVGDGWPDWTDGRTVVRVVTSLHDNARVLSLPPAVDPQSLVGQWARGGTMEAV